MDQGVYTEVNQTDQGKDIDTIELLTEAKPSVETVDGTYLTDGDQKKRIDYVLVYETCKEKEGKDEDAKNEANTLARFRRSFERRLQKKGLEVKHQRILVEKVWATQTNG